MLQYIVIPISVGMNSIAVSTMKVTPSLGSKIFSNVCYSEEKSSEYIRISYLLLQAHEMTYLSINLMNCVPLVFEFSLHRFGSRTILKAFKTNFELSDKRALSNSARNWAISQH